MVFSSKIFLFYFLPAVLAGYYLLKKNRTLSWHWRRAWCRRMGNNRSYEYA